MLPAHIIAQQLLALTLQEADSGLGRSTWSDWLGRPSVLGDEAMSHSERLMEHLASEGWLHEDTGLLSPGPVSRVVEAPIDQSTPDLGD